MSHQRGFAHLILILVTTLLVLGIISFLVYTKILSPSPKTSLPSSDNQVTSSDEPLLKTEYQNPFDEKSQYQNPFSNNEEGYQNPFDNLE